MPTLTIDIDADGSVHMDAKGFTGNACAKASEQIEAVLGGNGEVKKKKKPEFFAPPATTGNQIKRTF